MAAKAWNGEILVPFGRSPINQSKILEKFRAAAVANTVYAEVIDKAGNAGFTDTRIYFGEMNQVFLPLVLK